MVYCAGVNHDIPIRNNDIGLMCETLTVNYMAFAELSKYFIKKSILRMGEVSWQFHPMRQIRYHRYEYLYLY